MKKQALLILFFSFCITTLSFGQGLYLKGRYFYIPIEGTTILYGVALEKEFQNLWSVELGTSVSIFDETRDDGTFDKSTFVTIELRKNFEITKESRFFLNAYTGFANLINELNVEDPRSQQNTAKGLISGIGGGMKMFWTPKFGAELSISPRYFFSFAENSETVKKLKYGNLSLRIGFNFFWLF